MNNSVLRLKVEQRLNKLSSNDFDNIECWQIMEAFNKAQVEWVRRQLRGSNQFRDGDEQSKRRIDDLQVLLTEHNLKGRIKESIYFESDDIPANYMEYKRLTGQAKSKCCTDSLPLVIYLAEETNRDLILRDEHKKPSFEWGETFATFINNRVRIYTDGDFTIESPKLTYYRQPRKIEVSGCSNPDTLSVSTNDVISEFKDDIVEVIIDESVALLAGDIESINQYSKNTQSSERNN